MMLIPSWWVYFTLFGLIYFLLGNYLRDSRLSQEKDQMEKDFNSEILRSVKEGKLGQEDTVQFVFNHGQTWYQYLLEVLINPLNLITTSIFIFSVTDLDEPYEEIEEEFEGDE